MADKMPYHLDHSSNRTNKAHRNIQHSTIENITTIHLEKIKTTHRTQEATIIMEVDKRTAKEVEAQVEVTEVIAPIHRNNLWITRVNEH